MYKYTVDFTGADWRKAQSAHPKGDFVAVAYRDGVFALADSRDPDGPTLRFDSSEWLAFLDGVQRHEFAPSTFQPRDSS